MAGAVLRQGQPGAWCVRHGEAFVGLSGAKRTGVREGAGAHRDLGMSRLYTPAIAARKPLPSCSTTQMAFLDIAAPR